MTHIQHQFEHTYQVVSKKEFLNKESLGGEIPFFISRYEAIDENKIKEAIRLLKNRLVTNGISVLEINLFDLACEILEEKGSMDRMFRVEKSKGSAKFLRALQSSLNIHEVLLPRIKSLIKNSDAKLYFVTGIGLVFPFIRSHSILNNLQSIATNAPTIFFYPGEYDGHSLKLFNLLKDDNYYRAFNLEIIQA
ncbi:hypothetical protein BWI93_24025 [Siphonobacter sp. BAB-5385]|uniref:DUF1788 domain-containing protein n=1 Tax=Siphonobacter sp. BAB-5385 TaxID=1864822 RepID=UPI000B9E462B|nr:DUF1788 domain-containing protein [Siphonobacter sp. BAB-5385]OZI05706.1 hypothetical protein BWI93_24025 [Siphonobacter sp. BAB-5385]